MMADELIEADQIDQWLASLKLESLIVKFKGKYYK